QGEVCTCPSRALIHEDIAEDFLKLAIERVKAIKIGNPLDTETMMGAQASVEQMDKITSYLKSGPEEGAETLIGGGVNKVEGLQSGFYSAPTVVRGTNDMRSCQDHGCGPVLAVAALPRDGEAVKVSDDTNEGLGPGVWTRGPNTAYRAGRD